MLEDYLYWEFVRFISSYTGCRLLQVIGCLMLLSSIIKKIISLRIDRDPDFLPKSGFIDAGLKWVWVSWGLIFIIYPQLAIIYKSAYRL